MAKLASISTSMGGLEISINYNEGNRRVTSVDWALPQSGVAARVRVWNNGNTVYDRTLAGPSSGAESVPGNIRVVEVTEGGHTFLDLPASITYSINVESVGG